MSSGASPVEACDEADDDDDDDEVISDALVADCDGVLVHGGHYEFLRGDSVCDDGWVSPNLNCSAHDYDGGDCAMPRESVARESDMVLFDDALARPDERIYKSNADRAWWRNHVSTVLADAGPGEAPPIPVDPNQTASIRNAADSYRANGHSLLRGLLVARNAAARRLPL